MERKMIKVEKGKIQATITYIILFFIYFFLQYKNINDAWFVTDELDIMVGGKSIANGYKLYKDFITQHMPVSYYISALFDTLGAITVTSQRLAYYCFFALMWVIIYHRYQKVVNKYVLLFYPAVFLCVIDQIYMGTAILSEHIAGIGFVILYLEFLRYNIEKTVHFDNCIFISLSVLFTFGTTFVSIFGVFFIAIGVFGIEIGHTVNQKIEKKMLYILKKFRILLACIALPWIGIILIYALNGSLDDFIFQAYELNRTIYPKYLAEQYGASVFKTFFSFPERLAYFIIQSCSLNGVNYLMLLELIIVILAIVFIIHVYEEYGPWFGSVTVCFLISLTTRDLFGYHGTHFIEMISLFATATIGERIIVNIKRLGTRNLLYKAATALLLVGIAAGYLSDFSKFTTSSISEAKSEVALLVEDLTEPKECIWKLNFDNITPMTADRAYIGGGGCPWIWEGVGREVLQRFGEEPPRVLIYSTNHECWGHKQSEYAPELIDYIDSHYTYYTGNVIYLRNDYYEEIVGQYLLFDSITKNNSVLTPVGFMKRGDVFEQRVSLDMGCVTKISIMFGTYMRSNDVDLIIELVKTSNGEILHRQKVSAKEFLDNKYNEILLDKAIRIEESGEYGLRMYLENVNDSLDNSITLYRTSEVTSEEEYALLNGEPQEFSYVIKVLNEE